MHVLDDLKQFTIENEAFSMLLWAHGTCEVSSDLIPMRKLVIPASILRYGSILIEVTLKPKVFKSRPDEEAKRTYVVREGVMESRGFLASYLLSPCQLQKSHLVEG